ncbi:hypothetical protein EUGRSUZ_C02065 [Eucalyptus grandis]|uniref:Uncharacterized protein n=2 Tax=Eucalyptus grandis TaxID=71139 RepID=A0ACC3LGC4_EUCGR|nr:hypothetical protein EUGRSUZ_C02065 [Eucalyptus grandis]
MKLPSILSTFKLCILSMACGNLSIPVLERSRFSNDVNFPMASGSFHNNRQSLKDSCLNFSSLLIESGSVVSSEPSIERNSRDFMSPISLDNRANDLQLQALRVLRCFISSETGISSI